MHNHQEKVIATLGHYVITETTEFSKGQEFAGAVDTVRVEPGRYPIELRISRYGDRYIGATLTGTLVYSAWFGSNTRVERPMTPDHYTWQPRGYEAAGMAAKCDPRIELAEGVTVTGCQFKSTVDSLNSNPHRMLWHFCLNGEEFLSMRVIGEQFGLNIHCAVFLTSRKSNGVIAYLDPTFKTSRESLFISHGLQIKVRILRAYPQTADREKQLAREAGVAQIPAGFPVARYETFKGLVAAQKET